MLPSVLTISLIHEDQTKTVFTASGYTSIQAPTNEFYVRNPERIGLLEGQIAKITFDSPSILKYKVVLIPDDCVMIYVACGGKTIDSYGKK